MTEATPRAQRLCSEIQLFDLCEKERCGSRNGRFCTDPDLLARFERIAEEDAAPQMLDDPGTCEDDSEDEEMLGGLIDPYGEERDDPWEDD